MCCPVVIVIVIGQLNLPRLYINQSILTVMLDTTVCHTTDSGVSIYLSWKHNPRVKDFKNTLHKRAPSLISTYSLVQILRDLSNTN